MQAPDFSPYQSFDPSEWATLDRGQRANLRQSDINRLRSLNDRVSMAQVEDIYLPLTHLINLYVTAYLNLHLKTQRFLTKQGNTQKHARVPFIIGIAGSVAVGKSTTARLLQTLLAQWPNTPKVDLITTDGFLYPNAYLERQGIMDKKGFPESFDRAALLTFLSNIKAGKAEVKAPIYSHFVYDIIPENTVTISQPDVLIVEGINVLQPSRLPKDGKAIPFVSDFFDFSIYVDADVKTIENWYVNRFMTLRETAFRDPNSYFYRYSRVSSAEAMEMANNIWQSINLKNLKQNILPTRQRADLIIKKAENHEISNIQLRKI